jgi:hypothetical protein
MEEAKVLLASQIRPVEGLPDDDPDVAKCFLLLGHAGIGKTRLVHQVGLEVGAEVFAYHHGATVEEDNLGLPFIKDGIVHTAKPEHMPLFYRKPESAGGLGIFFQDEIFSGQGMGHQNISRMIIDRRHGASKMVPGWHLVGATNPETAEYATVKSVDKALASRMIILVLKPTTDEKLAYWSGRMHKAIYQFLLLNRGGSESYVEKLDSRAWCNLAHTIGKMFEAGVPQALMVKLLRTHTDSAVAAGFEAYLERGSDPDQYPIPAAELLTAEPARFEELLQRVRRWLERHEQRGEKAGVTALLGATKFELVAWLKNPERCASLTSGKDKRHAQLVLGNLAKFMVEIGSRDFADLASSLVHVLKEQDKSADSPLARAVLSQIKGTKLERRLLEMLDIYSRDKKKAAEAA